MILKGVSLAVLAVGMTASLAVFGTDYRQLSGVVRVIDGDTIEFITAGKVVRLAGIDAPESRQPCADHSNCGLSATAHLIQIIGGNPVTCTLTGLDVYQRRLGECFVPDGNTSLNRAMVLDGYAVDYPHFSSHRYENDQLVAQRNQRGLWAKGGFDTPYFWREQHKTDRVWAGGQPISPR